MNKTIIFVHRWLIILFWKNRNIGNYHMLDCDSIKQGHKHQAMGTRNRKQFGQEESKLTGGFCRECEI